jgi:hypothetical protein
MTRKSTSRARQPLAEGPPGPAGVTALRLSMSSGTAVTQGSVKRDDGDLEVVAAVTVSDTRAADFALAPGDYRYVFAVSLGCGPLELLVEHRSTGACLARKTFTTPPPAGRVLAFRVA